MTVEEFNKMREKANRRKTAGETAGTVAKAAAPSLAPREPKARRKPKHEEDRIQIACVKWFGYSYPKLKLLLHHSPNGGKREARTAAIFEYMGVRTGFPDLVLLVARGGWHGLFIEMKTRKGKQSEYQKEYERLVTEQGYKYCVCRSLDDFMEIINDYLKQRIWET